MRGPCIARHRGRHCSTCAGGTGRQRGPERHKARPWARKDAGEASPGPRRHLTPLATYGLDSRAKAASAMLQSMIIHEIPAHPGTPYEKLTFLRGQVEAIKARLSLTSQDIDAIIQQNKAIMSIMPITDYQAKKTCFTVL